MDKKFPRVCATCKHLILEDSGREFEQIVDTEYNVFSCEVLGWKVKEYHLMEPVGDIFAAQRNHQECPYWEEWEARKPQEFGWGEISLN